MLNSKERVLTTLKHKEPDRVPYDLGATVDTGIHYLAYQNLLKYLGKDHLLEDETEADFTDLICQIVRPHEEVLEELKVDVRGVVPHNPSHWELEIKEEGNYKAIVDELGMKWKKPTNGYYFDQAVDGHPLASAKSTKDIKSYPWPEPADPVRVQGLREEINKYGNNYAIAAGDPFGGIFALGFRMRGYKNFYLDLVGDPSFACGLMDKFTDLKIKYWEMALDKFGDLIQVIVVEDDLGQQDRTLVSPKMYRELVKPRHKRFISFLKKKAPQPTYIFLHSDGSIYDLIPDLIEIGVDILNPIQVSAANMETKRLKKEFGDELVFWGGGVDTQGVLSFGTPDEVREEVKQRIEDLAPGGGFVFTTIHDIQPEVPPENFIAMWETLREYGKY